jgi:antitoxin component of MazEF toxin-antitoxin module
MENSEGVFNDAFSLMDPILDIDGRWVVVIPPAISGELRICSGTTVKFEGNFLKIFLPEWIAKELQEDGEDQVWVRTADSKLVFHVVKAKPPN